MKKFYFTSESVTEGHPDKLCDYISDSISDRRISAGGSGISGDFPFRCNDHRCAAPWRIESCGSGIYILSGNSCHVWCQSDQSIGIWKYIFFHRTDDTMCRYADRIFSISRCDPLFDGIYQKT